MTDLFFHPHTKKALDALKTDLPQSLLLIGQPGTGLRTAGMLLADKNLASDLRPRDSKGAINDETGLISVEMIRNLYEAMRTRRAERSVVLIDNAERMSAGAQAAFLKLLEEPNPNVHFLLTSHNPQKLLPTVRSRVEELIVHPISEAQTRELIKSRGADDPKKQAQLLFIANGLPAEICRLIRDDDYFASRAHTVARARDFLQNDPYEKLLLLQEYRSDRDSAISLIDSCIHILRRSLSGKPQQAIVAQLSLLLEIRENITSNYNVALQLSRFVL